MERNKRVLKVTDGAVTRLTFWLTALKDRSSLWVPNIAVPVTVQPFPSTVGGCGGGTAKMDVAQLKQDQAELWTWVWEICGALGVCRLRM